MKKEIKKRETGLDEYQQRKREKSGFQTAFIMIVVVCVNGIICEFHTWAPPIVQGMVLAVFGVCCFSTMSVFRGAYFSDNPVHIRSIISLFSGLTVLSSFVLIKTLQRESLESFFVEGSLTHSGIFIVAVAFQLYITIISVIKFFMNKADSNIPQKQGTDLQK